MTHRHKLILLPPNRVWRTYPGGRTLDALAIHAAEVERVDPNALSGGAPAAQATALRSTRSTPADSHFAEDWIASTTRATNRGREHIAEGVSQVRVGHDPAPRDFAELLASDPEYFLGAAHVAKYGAQPQLLVKFLDSGTRLHFQVHPTRDFARRALGAPSGKTEAYYVLGNREVERVDPNALRASASEPPSALGSTRSTSDEPTGYIYAGFQRPPTRDALRAMIETQDIAAIEACFDKIPVQPGDTFIIPGGTPHALGAGLFLVEIQEPSDLVVRFEFERAGYVLPETARFMGRGLELCLDVFNLAPLTPADLAARVRCQPRRAADLGGGSFRDTLIDAAQTDCFRVAKLHLAAPVEFTRCEPAVMIVTHGEVTAETRGGRHRIRCYEKFLAPAGLGPLRLAPLGGAAEVLECLPPG